jgi:acetylornithine deacetylase/succinyl-diaminopimelate desuccinylase-like protein
MTMSATEYYTSQRDQFLDGLLEFLRIPSISTLPEHKGDIARAAAFLASELKAAGLHNTRLIEGEGNPIVSAEWMGAPGKPTVLLYGHYDVQPADPLNEWDSPPFEPRVRGDDVFARGASDDKGQTYLVLKAVEGLLQASGKLPVNVKFLIEGEEETGGEVLEEYLKVNGSDLGVDAALVCDTEMFAPDLPTLCTGLRGMVYTEVEVDGPRIDLHSGVYGGVAPNAIQAISEIIAGLKEPSGKVTIPGFYDDVKPPAPAELAAWERLPFDEPAYLQTEVGSRALVGEEGFSVLERIWARPSLDVHGIRGGFVGEGGKTVIPAQATAKISMRLVAEMDPGAVFAKFRQHVENLTPAGTRVSVRQLSSAPPALVDPDNRFVQTAARALTEVFGTEAVYIRSGGSIPVVGLLREHAGIPSVLMGFGLPDDNIHAPNEKFHLPNFYRGISAVSRYLEMLGA